MSRCDDCGWTGSNCDCTNRAAAQRAQGLVKVGELVGMYEASRLLDMTGARMWQLRRDDPDFPKPVAEVRATPLWLAPDLLNWQKNRVLGRPGRKRKVIV